jgi:hypothetical protein
MKVYDNPAITPIVVTIQTQDESYMINQAVVVEQQGNIETGIFGIQKTLKIDAQDLVGLELKMNNKCLIENEVYNIINPRLKKNNYLFDDFWVAEIKLTKKI